MKKIIFLATALIIFLGTFQTVNGESSNNTTSAPETNCILPPPASLNIVDITNTTMTVTWTVVPNAVRYKITAFNLDLGVPISTDIMIVSGAQIPVYTVTGLPMSTHVQIGVSASECMNGNFGLEIVEDGVTQGIIVVDLVIANQCSPGSGPTVSFFNGVSAVQYIQTTPYQTSPVTFDEGTIQAYKQASSKSAGWVVGLNIVANECSNGTIKCVCNPTGLGNITNVEVFPITGRMVFYTEGIIALEIYNIKKVAQNKALSFQLRTQESDVICHYDSRCATTSLTEDVCGNTGSNRPGANSHFQLDPTGVMVSMTGDDQNVINIVEANYNGDRNKDGQVHPELVPPVESISVAPNPFNDFTNIQYQITKQSPVTMTLFNAMGQVAKEVFNAEDEAPGYYSLPMDVADLAPGVYFLTIQTEAGRKTTTVIKQ